MGKDRDKREFFKVWGLPECRDARQEEPEPHQAKALGLLGTWFEKRGRDGGGGILVLPTGGGKTFTAVRFLAEGPLSEGYKVLWLAHTHHLLEQGNPSTIDVGPPLRSRSSCAGRTTTRARPAPSS
jgi:superfamily II DNA or RNA helicase